MMAAQRRPGNWTPDEDRRLLELIHAGKSWVLISANLKRREKSARARLGYLLRKAIKVDLVTTVGLGLMAKK
jgi:hypothetical protein